MTATPLDHKQDTSARRNQRYEALRWLWSADESGPRAADGTALRYNSSLPRVRACRLHPSDAEAGVTLRRYADDTARWSGLQSCGSTWACPVCADGIQSGRQADVSAMLRAAEVLGLTVGFLTFTVRHKRSQSLKEVWDSVSDAWRKMTSGDPRRWNADRDEFGLVGYLRLWEVTHGDSGWHVHVHALVFLDPNGREVVKRTPVPIAHDFVGPLRAPVVFIGPMPAGVTAPAAVESREFVGPLREGQQRPERRLRSSASLPRAPYMLDDGSWTRRRPDGPLPAPVLVADKRAYTLTGPQQAVTVPCARADRNCAADSHTPGRVQRRGLYARDVADLAASMYGRWIKNLPGNMAPPLVCRDTDHRCQSRRLVEKAEHTHGFDARIVRDGDALADYFTKNRLKPVESTASDVTSSSSKTARAGNRTPFGILADLVAGDAGPGDHDLWREWEAVSKGRRQLRPSDGLRDLLGLGDEADDADLADAANEPAGDDEAPPVDLLRATGRGYRDLARAGFATWACDLAETWDLDVLDQLAASFGIYNDDDDVALARLRVAFDPRE